MNIAIIEKGHFEVTYTLVSLFDNGDNNITVFIDEASFRQLKLLLPGKTNRYTWVIKNKNESNRQFISRIFQHLHHHPFHLIYFNTIEDNFIVYTYNLQRSKFRNAVLTLHDINGFFEYKPSFGIRRLIRYIGKKRLVSLIPSFNVLSATLTTYLYSKLPESKKVFNIPGSFFDRDNYTPLSFSAGNILRITIPGSVDTRRRNYELVFELLNLAQLRNINISVVLLGAFKKGNSEKIREKCEAYIQKNNNLHFYHEEIVDQPEFDKVIRESHFLWIPLQTFSIISDGIKEYYGTTTSSGNIADIIRHAKPFFAPAWLSLENVLEKSATRYKSVAELIQVLEQLSPAGYSFLQETAYQASLHYTKDQIINRNADLFL